MECSLVNFPSALGNKGFYILHNTGPLPLLLYSLSNYLKTEKMGNVFHVEANSPEALKSYKVL